MPTPTQSKPPSSGEPSDSRQRSSRPWTAGALVAVVIGVVVALYVANRPEPAGSTPLVPVFDHVEAQGYVANRSLAGRFRPGDVLQTMDPEPLATPVLALRSELCFPDLEPTRAPFPLPEDTASSEASFGLSGAQVTKVFPGLALDDSAASGYRLLFDRPEVVTLPKLEMSGRFSNECVERLDAAQTAGDRQEWFVTVHEAVVAEGITLEVTWKRGTSADVQASIRQQTEEALAEGTPSRSGSDNDGSDEALLTAGRVRMEASDSRKTVWKVDVPVVLGYRTRPMEYRPAATTSGRASAGSVVGAIMAAAVLAADEDDPRDAFTEDGDGSFVGRLAIRFLSEDGEWRRVSAKHSFGTGDRFRFEVESSRPARLFVFHQPPGGERSELWPAGRDDENRIDRGRPVMAPTPPAAFEMQDETGLETFYIALADVEVVERQRPAEVPLGNYVLRGLDEADTRGVGIVDDAEPWLYFRPDEGAGYLAAVGFQLDHDPH